MRLCAKFGAQLERKCRVCNGMLRSALIQCLSVANAIKFLPICALSSARRHAETGIVHDFAWRLHVARDARIAATHVLLPLSLSAMIKPGNARTWYHVAIFL